MRKGLGATQCIGPEGGGSSAPNQLEWTDTNQFRINWRKAGGGIACDFQTSTISDTTSWHHVLFSFDLSQPTAQIYVDGALDVTVVGSQNVNIDNTANQWGLFSDNGGNLKYDGAVAEFWLALNQYLDVGNPAVRAKFRDDAGKPVDLGSDGSLPSGTPPTIYLRLRPGDPTSAFAVNHGSGGGFALNGELDPAPSSPSD